MKHRLAITSLLLIAGSLSAAFIEKKVSYDVGDTTFESVLVYNDEIDERAPAVLMIPNWMGVTPEAIKKAKLLADDDYVFFVVDTYGKNTRPQNSTEAGEAAGKVRDDRPMMRERAQKALDVFLSQQAPINKGQTAAIGFCFGGGAVLELGRSGADLDAIVSFHGDLNSPTLEADAGATKGSILVLHGADDPYVPQKDVEAFVDAYSKTKIDWQLVQFSNTVHSFTNPQADTPGKSAYNKLSCERAYDYMEELFEEKFD